MADRPIICSAPLVRAILEGRKTQHRLPIKGGVPAAPSMAVHPDRVGRHAEPYLDAYCSDPKTPANPRGMSSTWCWWTRDDRMGREFEVGFAPGDRLWIPEDYQPATTEQGDDVARFRIDGAIYSFSARGAVGQVIAGERSPLKVSKWRQTPRWASRLTLLVTDVRVERLQAISEADAIAEGMREPSLREMGGDLGQAAWSERQVFSRLWKRLHGADAWTANPWVVALTFTVLRANIDALPAAGAERELADA